jgi:hypothetical protein
VLELILGLSIVALIAVCVWVEEKDLEHDWKMYQEALNNVRARAVDCPAESRANDS